MGLAVILTSSLSFATGSGITYHGRLIAPNGQPVIGNNVQFRIQLRTPGNENCLLYEEIQAKNLSQTSGVFTVTLNDGNGVRTDTSGYGLDQIFANRGSFSFAAGKCIIGSTYSPNPADGRKIQVFFNDGTLAPGQWEPMPSMALNFVPLAIESQQVGGYKKEQLLRLADGVSTTQSELSGTTWSDLLALIGGTSNKYVKPTDQVTQLYGAPVPTPSNGQSIRWNTALNAGAGGWENFTAGTASGTIAIANGGTGQTSKTAGFDALSPTTTKGDLIVSNGTNNVRLPVGTNGYFLQADSAQASGVKWAAVTDTLAGMSCSSGDLPTWTGSAWACRGSNSANSTSTLVLRDGSGNFAANQATLNTLKVDNGSGSQVTVITPAAFTSWQLRLPPTAGTANQVLKTDGSGNTDWTTITSTPGGSSGQVQFNSSSNFAGDSNLNWDNTNKRLGVGTTTPAAAVDINGSVKVGTDAAACSSTNKGSIRYNNATSVLEFCNGSSWNLVQAAACSDATPNVFAFTDEANATTSTLYTSNIIQITGFNCSVPVTVSGAGSPQFQICNDATCTSVAQGWTSSPSAITNNQYLQVRLTSDAAGGATFQATVFVGSGASVWSVTNTGGDCTASPVVGTVCTDGTIYAGLSPDGNVKMFTTRCDAGQSWDGTSCTGARLQLSWNNGTGSFTTTGLTGTSSGKSNSATLFALADAGAPYAAATYCENLSENGKTDWYLPSTNEMVLLSNGRNAIRNFLSFAIEYVTSSENANAAQSVVVINNGAIQSMGKNFARNVRCVRR